jgi:arginyl-tRNA--protein-N-Asp/Glu arginylyltransferase
MEENHLNTYIVSGLSLCCDVCGTKQEGERRIFAKIRQEEIVIQTPELSSELIHLFVIYYLQIDDKRGKKKVLMSFQQ